MHTRREFIKFAAMMAGATGLNELASEPIRRASAIEPAPGSTYLDAEHIVILMQENRSFDHAFGVLRGVRGFNDPRAMRLSNGNSVFVQTDASGASYAPWRLDIKDTKITWMGSLPHSRQSQVDAWNEGLHDGWLEAKRSGEKEYAHLPLTMGYYTREDLPFYYALADAFTICDQNYCSVMTSTSPNRSYFWSGTIRDAQNANSKVHIRNEQIDDGGMTWKTFPERLQEAGISWKAYQNELTRSGLSGEEDAWLSNFGDNVLECFAAYNVEAYPGFIAAAKQWVAELSTHVDKLESALSSTKDDVERAKLNKKLEATRKQIDAVNAAMAKGGEARYNLLSEREKALHHAAFVTNAGDPHYHALDSLSFDFEGQQRNIQVPKGDVLFQFRKDVDEGKLPTISWLTASERFSDHPSSPWYGAWYISEVMDILTKNPEVWKKTIFILTYDENDGYFDHAPSFAAADPKRPETGGASAGVDTGLEYTYKTDELRMGVAEEEARSGPIGMGYRVPMIVASPWSRGGWVNSQLFDHTSTLMFLERFLKEKHGKTVCEDNISAWRRTVAGDLTSVFRSSVSDKLEFNYLDRDQFAVRIAEARYRKIPSNYARLTSAQIEQINRAPQTAEWIPQQEKGVRPSCALPYELYVDSGLSSDGAAFELKLAAGVRAHGANSAGAPFNVYLRNLNRKNALGNSMRAATYAVKPGDSLIVPYPLSLFADSRYVIEIAGPNGFYRFFAGSGASRAIEARTAYEHSDDKFTGNLLMSLRNGSDKSASVEIRDNAYGAMPAIKAVGSQEEISIVLPLERSHGWYDITVTEGGAHAETRFAGRVETGRESVSDPAMAGIDSSSPALAIKRS